MAGACAVAPSAGDTCNVGTVAFSAGGFAQVTFNDPDKNCAYDYDQQEPLYCGASGPDPLIDGANTPSLSRVGGLAWIRTCRHFQHLGDRCKTNVPPSTAALQCEPGLTCSSGICGVPCAQDSNCPCANGQSLFACDSSAGLCKFCSAKLNDRCDNLPGQGCCDPAMACSQAFTNGVDTTKLWGDAKCKMALGQVCAGDDDCQFHGDTPPPNGGPPRKCVARHCQAVPRALGEACTMQTEFPVNDLAKRSGITAILEGPSPRNDYCAASLVCDTATLTCLGNVNATCTVDTQCAQTLGFKCVSGVCKTPPPPCVAGGVCTIAGQLGECAKGTFQCPGGSRVCVAKTPTPTAEICDGKDNDCDGKVDNDIAVVGMACTTATDPNCQPGFSVPGLNKCTNGKLSCSPNLCNLDNASAAGCYCAGPGDAAGGHGLPCGMAAATPCTSGLDLCVPDSACVSSSPDPRQSTCQPSFPQICAHGPPSCYTPTDVKLPPNQCL